MEINCISGFSPFWYPQRMSLKNDDTLFFRCKSTDKDDWKAAAEQSGRSLSNWIVWTLNNAAEQELKAADKSK
ncbi:MAG: hypothetical protein KDA76_01355 [Planctomycetaceae bacterium]|nr:hypothetical protein [Planctomycetaceae bacterium]